MSEEFDEGCGRIRRPEGYGAVLVAEVENGVTWVLGEGSWGAEFGWIFDDETASGCVLVFEVACVSDSGEEEMVWEKLHGDDFDVFSQAVELDEYSMLISLLPTLLWKRYREILRETESHESQVVPTSTPAWS